VREEQNFVIAGLSKPNKKFFDFADMMIRFASSLLKNLAFFLACLASWRFSVYG